MTMLKPFALSLVAAALLAFYGETITAAGAARMLLVPVAVTR